MQRDPRQRHEDSQYKGPPIERPSVRRAESTHAGRFPVKPSGARLDKDDVDKTDKQKRRKISKKVGAALAGLARRTGCSLQQHPMPELREVGHEWRRLVTRRV